MRSTTAAFGLLVTILAGCSGVRVDHDYDRSADFGSLRSYRWIAATKTGDPALDNTLLRGRIRNAVDAALSAKGYRKADTGPVDFNVATHVSKQSKVDVESIPVGFGYGWGFGATETEVDQYEEGTLMLDIVDSSATKLLWRGTGKTRLYPGQSPAERDREVSNVVNAILKSFPPGSE
jgi:hypothetical protein